MKKRSIEGGFTLVELLAVLVILGIISIIAIISVSRVIQDATDRAFVANAYALKEAANLYLRSESINDRIPSLISYKTLYEADYLDEMKDPDTDNYLTPTDETYVVASGQTITAVCLQGERRNLCSYQEKNQPIPFNKLSATFLSMNN
ncbi:prepilin-type N-terminal cleavage/methylation domain-containing protein [Bacillus rubiinfantis]|uniref:prepilin-type N-terminal cleavage/methylation domain-containing protein n=1 Tax=Bacillus rubiinfantis TaxID=1499680 RepID=UPI0005A7CB42|nr:prepilin-type N-terminal cleavage/methylation domain-containing protein [Bacillus rubiinfantis]